MFRALILALSLIGASAFVPASSRANSALRMSYENAIGAQPPLGFFDPLGLLNGADSDRFERLRFVETKHGRFYYHLYNPINILSRV